MSAKQQCPKVPNLALNDAQNSASRPSRTRTEQRQWKKNTLLPKSEKEMHYFVRCLRVLRFLSDWEGFDTRALLLSFSAKRRGVPIHPPTPPPSLFYTCVSPNKKILPLPFSAINRPSVGLTPFIQCAVQELLCCVGEDGGQQTMQILFFCTILLCSFLAYPPGPSLHPSLSMYSQIGHLFGGDGLTMKMGQERGIGLMPMTLRNATNTANLCCGSKVVAHEHQTGKFLCANLKFTGAFSVLWPILQGWVHIFALVSREDRPDFVEHVCVVPKSQ